MELYSKAMWLLRRDIWNWREYAGTLSILKSSLWLVKIQCFVSSQGASGHLGIVSQDLRMNLDHLPASWFRARMLPETCRNHWYPLVKHRISHKEHIFILLFMYLPIPILLEPKHPTDTEWQAKVPRTGRATELLPRILLTKCTEPGWVVAGTKSTNGQECRALSPWGPDTLRKSHSKWGALEVFFWNQGWKPGGWYKLHGSDPQIVDELEVWFG